MAAAAVGAGYGGRGELPNTSLPGGEQPPKFAQACGRDPRFRAYTGGTQEPVKLGSRDEISAGQL